MGLTTSLGAIDGCPWSMVDGWWLIPGSQPSMVSQLPLDIGHRLSSIGNHRWFQAKKADSPPPSLSIYIYSIIWKIYAYDLHIFVVCYPSTPSAAYMRHWTRSVLVQLMACRLLGAKSIHEPMLTYCQLNTKYPISVKFESKYKTSIHEN